MADINLEGESFLLDVAVAIVHGLKKYKYEPGATSFLAREEAIRIKVYDPEQKTTYTIVIKEEVQSETDTEVQS